jgi:4-hydroxy-tetrahydrodipicolinate synthase
MSRPTKIDGVLPALVVPYTDESCNTIDEVGFRRLVSRLLEHEIGGLVVGAHASEIAYLDRDERRALIAIAAEEAQGRVPVVGGVTSDSTREAIQQGLDAKEAGADAVLFTPPSIPAWTTLTDADLLVGHYRAFDEAVDIPIIMFAAPLPMFGNQFYLTPATAARVVEAVENVVGCKISAEWEIGGFMRVTKAVKSVRDIGCLHAGGAAQFASYLYGSDGILSGGSNFSIADDVAVRRLVQEGDLTRARACSDAWNPVWDVVYGYQIGTPVVYFHYRYKLATWMLGHIDQPYMRLPQRMPPADDLQLLYDALVEAGQQPVRTPADLSSTLAAA